MGLKIAVLISGGGSNLQAIIDRTQDGFVPDVGVVLVVSNTPDAFGLERARRAGIEALYIDPAGCASARDYNSRIADACSQCGATLICLAGYLLLVQGPLLERFAGRIINIHPALLPRFGGRGMYGRRVHEAVIAAGERFSGATVHCVDDRYDHGAILLQQKVPVLPGDTPERLAARVLAAEHEVYPAAIARIADGSIPLPYPKEDA